MKRHLLVVSCLFSTLFCRDELVILTAYPIELTALTKYELRYTNGQLSTTYTNTTDRQTGGQTIRIQIEESRSEKFVYKNEVLATAPIHVGDSYNGRTYM